MISCDVFRKKLYDFQEGNISENQRLEMEKHKTICKDCCRLFNEEKSVEIALRKGLSERNDEFTSSKEIILDDIDKNKYGRSISRKIYFNIRRRIVSYTLCVAIIIVCAFLYPNAVNTLTNINASTGNSSALKTQENKIKDDKTAHVLKESLLTLPENVGDSDASGLLQKIKGKDLGYDNWTIVYSGAGKVIFYNSPGLLAYTTNGDSGQYYGAVDLEKIRCNFMSGETVSMIEPSPNGDLVTIWNWDVEALVNGNTNIYVYDLVLKRTKIFERDNKDDIIGSWSASSRYYAYGDRSGKYINVYDAIEDKAVKFPLNAGSLKQVFSSDNGDILAVSGNVLEASGKNYFMKKTGDKYSVEELPITGEMLGFTKSGSIAYFEKGSVMEYNFTGSSVIKEIGNNFKLISPYKITGARDTTHPMFSDGTSTIVFNLDKSFYSYDFGNNLDKHVNLSDDSKECFVTSDFKKGEVITSDGIKAYLSIDDPSNPLNCYFLNRGSLVRISQKNNSNKLSDFELIEYKLEN